MNDGRSKDRSRLGAIDYLLVATGSCLAAYSAGISISNEPVAHFFVQAIAIGTAVSYLLRLLLSRSAVVKIDGILYGGALLIAVLLTARLNALLPNEGFPRDVMMAGVLSWMLLLGSVVTWRDGTLLFQAIPSVALFGLVGCYDTFRQVPFYFFGFLMCLATLLGRTHGREMLRQAVESGYFNRADAPNAPSEAPEQSPELFEDIKKGPWRWLAGPEWALASALAIVLVSFAGAPVIQAAVKPISGIVSIPTPSIKRGAASASAPAPESSYMVGRGPNTGLSQRTLYSATLDHARYLRTASYEVYTGRGWRSSDAVGPVVADIRTAQSLAIDTMGRNVREAKFSIRPEVPTQALPLPGEVKSLDHLDRVRLRADGGGGLYGSGPVEVSGSLWEPTLPAESIPYPIPIEFSVIANTHAIAPSVIQFARNAAKGGKTDAEKAEAIRTAISQQCRYNLRAAAVPNDQDPAEWFLFEGREGYCDLFATSMVLSARSIGIPARYVIGYLPEDRFSDGRGHFIVREADYHAWAELFFKDAGWVVFDATAGAAEVEGAERGATDESAAFWKQDWFGTLLNGAIVFTMIVGAFFVARARRQARPKDPKRVELERTYLAFNHLLQRASGKRRLPGQTPDEFLAVAAPSLNGAGEAASALNARISRAMFGPEPPTDADLASLKHEVRALGTEIRRRK